MPAYVALHGRDHCPGGADPIPCFPLGSMWRGYRATDQTCPSGDDIVIEWEEWENTNSSIFEENLTGGGDVGSVMLHETGIYSIYAQYDWETGFPDNQLYWINIVDGWNNNVIYQTRYGWSSVGDGLAQSLVKTYHPFIGNPGGDPAAEIAVYAGQNSGAPRDVDAGFAQLEIIYMGPLPTTA